MKRILFAAIAVTLHVSVYAQGVGAVSPGFEAVSSVANPVPYSAYATLPDGTRVHFDGAMVTHHAADGSYLSMLHAFPSFVFTGAIAADPSGDSVLVGESTYGDLYRVDMDGSGATYLATLPNNYAAAYDARGSVLVSAAVCGWACGNDLVRIDTLTGAATTVAHVSGPSGALGFAPNGDLYYGPSVDTFPAPAGIGELWLFDARALASGQLLGDSDASVVASGLDIISSIAVDPVIGDIVVSTNTFDSSFNVIADSLLILRPSGEVKDTIAQNADAYRSCVELRQGGGIGHFRAYQPEGVVLTYLTGDVIEEVQPKRPSAYVQFNGGASFAFVVTGAEPGGAMLVTFGDSSFHQGVESSYMLAFDFLFHTGLPINRIRRLGPTFLIPCDSSGTAIFPFWDIGSLFGTIVFQGVITDTQGDFIGSSEAAFH